MTYPAGWEDWMARIPFLQFPSDWKVRVLPSFGGVAARFVVINSNGVQASVFLTLHGTMTIDAPCWEVNDSDLRFPPEATDEMLAAIANLKKRKSS